MAKRDMNRKPEMMPGMPMKRQDMPMKPMAPAKKASTGKSTGTPRKK